MPAPNRITVLGVSLLSDRDVLPHGRTFTDRPKAADAEGLKRSNAIVFTVALDPARQAMEHGQAARHRPETDIWEDT